MPRAKTSDALGLLMAQLCPFGHGALNLGPRQNEVPYFGGSPVSEMHNVPIPNSCVTSRQAQQWGHTVCPLPAMAFPTLAV